MSHFRKDAETRVLMKMAGDSSTRPRLDDVDWRPTHTYWLSWGSVGLGLLGSLFQSLLWESNAFDYEIS